MLKKEGGEETMSSTKGHVCVLRRVMKKAKKRALSEK